VYMLLTIVSSDHSALGTCYQHPQITST